MANNNSLGSFACDVTARVTQETISNLMCLVDALHEHREELTTLQDPDSGIPVVGADVLNELRELDYAQDDENPEQQALIEQAIPHICRWETMYDDSTRRLDWSLQDGSLLLYEMEAFDARQVVQFVQLLCQLFPAMRALGPWSCSWAVTCDAERPDQFGGGLVVFNHEKAAWLNQDEWERTQRQLLTYVGPAHDLRGGG